RRRRSVRRAGGDPRTGGDLRPRAAHPGRGGGGSRSLPHRLRRSGVAGRDDRGRAGAGSRHRQRRRHRRGPAGPDDGSRAARDRAERGEAGTGPGPDAVHRADRRARGGAIRRPGAGSHRWPRRRSRPRPGGRPLPRRVARLSRSAGADPRGGHRRRGSQRARPPAAPREASAHHRHGAPGEACGGEDGPGAGRGADPGAPARPRRGSPGHRCDLPHGRDPHRAGADAHRRQRGQARPPLGSGVSFDPSGPGLAGHAFGLPHTPDEARVVLVPVPFEATTSYGGGTSRGPAAVLRASRQVDLFDLETRHPYVDGIAMLDEDPGVRAWNSEAQALAEPIVASGGARAGEPALARVNALCEALNHWLEATVGRLLADGKLVATVGGDHGSLYGAIAAHAHAYPGLGILQLDAHPDLRDTYQGFTWSHASIFHKRVARPPGVSRLGQVAVRALSAEEMDFIRTSRGRVVFPPDAALKARAFEGEPWARQVDRIVHDLPEQVYLSFDIDGLDPTLCPHTGTPVPGGLSFPEVTALVAGGVRWGRRMVGVDLAEVAPGPEGDEWDGNVGARLLYKMIGWALRSQRGGEGR